MNFPASMAFVCTTMVDRDPNDLILYEDLRGGLLDQRRVG